MRDTGNGIGQALTAGQVLHIPHPASRIKSDLQNRGADTE
jgi:hypothetical protein